MAVVIFEESCYNYSSYVTPYVYTDIQTGLVSFIIIVIVKVMISIWKQQEAFNHLWSRWSDGPNFYSFSQPCCVSPAVLLEHSLVFDEAQMCLGPTWGLFVCLLLLLPDNTAILLTLANGERISFVSICLFVWLIVCTELVFFSATSCRIETKLSSKVRLLMENVFMIITTS